MHNILVYFLQKNTLYVYTMNFRNFCSYSKGLSLFHK